MVIVCYGLAPFTGALFSRYKWYKFRKRFDELRLCPLLDYSGYWQEGAEKKGAETSPPSDASSLSETNGVFRFTGDFESVTDGQTLWLRSDDLTVPVSLKNAESYLLSGQKSGGLPEGYDPNEAPPEKIRWEKVSTLTEGARVFVGGPLQYLNGHLSFVSTKENPLIVIFYDGSDHSLATRVIRSSRHHGEYWNFITPYSLIIGALCLILMALFYRSRPAYNLTVTISVIALFIPFYSVIPPGLLFTVVYRRLSWRARALRACGDLARLPLRYLAAPGEKGPLHESRLFPGGKRYGYIRCPELPAEAREGKIPFLLPESSKTPAEGGWYVFGQMGESVADSKADGAALGGGDTGQPPAMPVIPEDPFAVFGILSDDPDVLARRCIIKAYSLETAAWIFMLGGIGLNIFFVRLILILL
jgi:hypothetical protein